jgi:lipoate-protein ligase A
VVSVVEQVGTVGELHGLDPFDGGEPVVPAVWWCRPTDDAIVLGSRQRDDLVDEAACVRTGLSIVHRRSGGGAVIMRRASILWVDVVLPAGIAPDDVRGSMVWIGERWREVLAPVVDRPLTVHRGGMECSAWSDLVCFAGVGPGEVLVGPDKLVGLSQRRTRRGIRVQGLVYGASVAGEYRTVLRGSLPSAAPGGQAWQPGLDGGRIAAALAQRITTRTTPL